jgi:hypothetical protein
MHYEDGRSHSKANIEDLVEHETFWGEFGGSEVRKELTMAAKDRRREVRAVRESQVYVNYPLPCNK